MSGKGDTYRRVDGPTYRENFARALGEGEAARQRRCESGHASVRYVIYGEGRSTVCRETRCVECGKELARVQLDTREGVGRR